ncbi:MAG: nicotinamide mononucleotide deamidase-related protein YfaY [Methylomicrobium sp.]
MKTPPTLEIFSQGEEIVTGQTVDTNAAWLAQRGIELGFTVTRHTAVGDRLDDLIELLTEIAARADCCICTGGLGPTSDDLTAEAVARAFARPLSFDRVALEQIQNFFERRQRTMPDINRKQAYLPAGAQRIDNHWGTAPGFTLQQNRCRFFFLPGVPSEMRQLFDTFVKIDLKRHFATTPQPLITLKTVGIGESDLQTALADIDFPPDIRLGFRAGTEHVETKLQFPADYPADRIDDWTQRVRQRIGAFVFSVDNCDLPETVDRLMREKRLTAAFVETASQGLLTAKCVAACDWLIESHYASNRERLTHRFAAGIDAQETIDFANAIAYAVQQDSGADLILVQLYETANGKTIDSDNSLTLYNTLLGPDGLRHTTHTIGGPLKRKINQAALLSLDTVRRHLQNLL